MERKYGGVDAATASAVTYGLISIAITLFNKAVLSSYNFDSTMTLTFLQGMVTLVCLDLMKRRKLIDYPNFDWGVARKVAPLSFVFIAYVVISLVSLGRVNVPMFTALRRLTIVFVMIEEFYMLGILPSSRVMHSVIIMCIGAAIAAYRDLTFDLTSYTFLFLTNLFTSLYTVYINVIKKETNLNVFAMMYYNNVTTMPALLFLAYITGDLGRAWEFPLWGDIFFQINFQASVFLAFALNLSTFYCTTLNSARTQTVVGQLKNFIAFLLGLVLFHDYKYDPYNLLGLLVGFAGGVYYSWVTYVEKLAKDAAKKGTPSVTAVAPRAGGGDAVPLPGTPSVDNAMAELTAALEAGSGANLGSSTSHGGGGQGMGSVGKRGQHSAGSRSAGGGGGGGSLHPYELSAQPPEDFGIDHSRGLVGGGAGSSSARDAAKALRERHGSSSSSSESPGDAAAQAVSPRANLKPGQRLL